MVLSNNTKDLVAKILMESDNKILSCGLDFNTLAARLQEIYPSGNKSGTSYSWRDSNETIDVILCDSANKGVDLSDERLTALAKKVQECFPVMRMRYANGTDSPFYFRCNKTEIKNKLKKFLTVYGDVADDDIIDATKRYVATYASKGYLGMRLAKYFILKEDRKLMADEEVHVEEISDLATFLENKVEEEDIVNGDDLLMNSRN